MAQKSRLYSDVEFLTGIKPYRNCKNLDSLKTASDYISNEFEKTGLKAEEQTWTVKRNIYRNIIASYKPDKIKRLIIGAHYDVAYDQPGADDNASGIAGLLETSRMITESNPELDYGIDFVAYCLEEPPHFGEETMGSWVHARSLFEKMTPVIGMICYEMIGYYSDEPESQKFPDGIPEGLYPDTGNYICLVGLDKYWTFNERLLALMSVNSGIGIEFISVPASAGFAAMSDHMNYWSHGYKAVMITDGADYRNDNYHQKSDTIDTLDFDRMAEVVNSTFNSITKLE